MSNARSAIKIDIVNPIPPKNPIPIIFFQFRPEGNEQRPKLTPVKENSHIPRGFPIKSPVNIPILRCCPNPSVKLFPVRYRCWLKQIKAV